SAAALVRRHGWRRQRDNHGRVIALVPNDGPELRRMPDNQSDNPPYQPDRQADHRPDISAGQPDHPPHAAFETALAAIETAHARELHARREGADAVATQFEETEKRADRAERRADRAEGARDGERARADALRERLDVTQDELQQARDAADQARQH